MQDEIVFVPDRRGVNLKHVLLIFGGFVIVMQFTVLQGEPLSIRLAVTGAFAAFLLFGLRLGNLSSNSWPQEIVINRSGISYSGMKARHGIDLVPWNEIERMDLFKTDTRLPPHLRIGLKSGSFQQRIRKTPLQRLSMGLDIKIPVAVDATPAVVLDTAERFWRESRSTKA